MRLARGGFTHYRDGTAISSAVVMGGALHTNSCVVVSYKFTKGDGGEGGLGLSHEEALVAAGVTTVGQLRVVGREGLATFEAAVEANPRLAAAAGLREAWERVVAAVEAVALEGELEDVRRGWRITWRGAALGAGICGR